MRNLEVIISERAEYRLDEILQYLDTEFPPAVRKTFLKKLYKVIRLISRMPEMFPVSFEFADLRKCVLTKQTVIFYRVKNNFVEIVTFHDTRTELTDIGV